MVMFWASVYPARNPKGWEGQCFVIYLVTHVIYIQKFWPELSTCNITPTLTLHKPEETVLIRWWESGIFQSSHSARNLAASDIVDKSILCPFVSRHLNSHLRYTDFGNFVTRSWKSLLSFWYGSFTFNTEERNEMVTFHLFLIG